MIVKHGDTKRINWMLFAHNCTAKREKINRGKKMDWIGLHSFVSEIYGNKHSAEMLCSSNSKNRIFNITSWKNWIYNSAHSSIQKYFCRVQCQSKEFSPTKNWIVRSQNIIFHSFRTPKIISSIYYFTCSQFE